MALRRRDLEGVLSFVADAHDADADEALTTALLDRLTELVGCEYATYERFDWRREIVAAYVPCSNEDPSVEERGTPIPKKTWQSCAPYTTAAGFEKASDDRSRRQREWIRDHEEYNAEFGIVDKLGFGVGAHGGLAAAWLHFASQGRDFGERDRELALTLRQHVDALWRKAISRRQVTELLAELERDDGRASQAVVLLGTGTHVDYATEEARALLAAWFGTVNGRLPHELGEWVVGAAPGDCYTARRNGTVLAVVAAGDHALTLREHASAPPAVTPREREVLALVAEGLTNAEIAQRLWVAPSTVAKHLEQAYAKLGVHTRTAAVARLAAGTR